MKKEPFLKNPCWRRKREVNSMGELFLLNPKVRKKTRSAGRRKKLYGVVKTSWGGYLRGAAGESGYLKPQTLPSTAWKSPKPVLPAWLKSKSKSKKKRSAVKSAKTVKIKAVAVRKKALKRRVKRGVTMAKSKLTKYGKPHSLTVYRSIGGMRVSRRARLVSRYRGRLINPLIPSRGELMTVAGIAGGFVASRYLPRLFEKMLPPMFATGLPKVAVQTATGLGLSYVVSNVVRNRELGANIATGALLNAAITLIDMYLLKGVLSEEGISALAEQVPEVVSESPADTPETLPAGFSEGEDDEVSADQDVIVM